MGEQRVNEPTGLAGVIGDGARRQIDRGTWEARHDEGDGLNVRWEDITVGRSRRESEGFIVAKKRLIPVERRDPTENMFG